MLIQYNEIKYRCAAKSKGKGHPCTGTEACEKRQGNNNNNNNNNGATGIVTRSLRKSLEAVPGRHSIDSLQKSAVLGTSHIVRKVLQCEA